MSPFENLAFMVPVLLSLRMSDRRVLQDLSRDVFRSAAAGTDEMYVRRYSFNIFEIPRLNMCSDSKRSERSRTPAFLGAVQIKKYNGDCEKLSRVISAFLSTCLVSQALWECWRLAGCLSRNGIEFFANYMSCKLQCLSKCRRWTASIVVRHQIWGRRTGIRYSTENIIFASGILHQNEMRTGKQDCVWPELWWAWAVALPLA